jgi:hypothetical protein
MNLGDKSHLNTRNKFSKWAFPNPKVSLSILNEIKEPRFWWKWEKSAKSKRLEP